MAEDAVQQTLLRAWAQLPQLRDVERYEVWLRKLLVSACYDELRRHRRWKDRITVLPVDGPASPDPFVSADDRDALDRAFARLAPDRRAAFVLHHDAGLPLTEIAEILGLPVGTVKSRLHYSIETLRAALDADARIQAAEAPGA
jgi:RNA polymerase sigma-70 factor (ECF subfamily)